MATILTTIVDGTTIVIFNGNLYNKNGQQSQFQSQHQGFSGGSDHNATAVVVTSAAFACNVPQYQECNKTATVTTKPCLFITG